MGELRQTLQDALARVTRHRQVLPDLDLLGVAIVSDEVGEGSADVDPHHETHADHSPVLGVLPRDVGFAFVIGYR